MVWCLFINNTEALKKKKEKEKKSSVFLWRTWRILLHNLLPWEIYIFCLFGHLPLWKLQQIIFLLYVFWAHSYSSINKLPPAKLQQPGFLLHCLRSPFVFKKELIIFLLTSSEIFSWFSPFILLIISLKSQSNCPHLHLPRFSAFSPLITRS